ncbi:MAG: hypothetical protein JNM65_17360 [Verrucomicrobiaceae bacterium]|nr:hypothetical protein [Verrucomicrobiaceae bacterium]
MSAPSHTPPSIVTEAATFIGINYHSRAAARQTADRLPRREKRERIKRYGSGTPLTLLAATSPKAASSITTPHDFAALIKRWPNPRVVFEAS